ncbi:MAG TPA: hypothetical protein VGI63_04215 [Verrucomicrobiae bacterium]|jgi:uncharacterized protein YggT (Ycf19 family)
MAYVDFILNLAGLLLWLNWRSIRFDPLVKRTPATLMGTLRPAAPKQLHRWHLLVFLVGILFLRALIYRWIAPFWVGSLDLGVTLPQFRSDKFATILAFSFLSFGLMLGIFYVGLLLLSLLKGPEPVHQLVKIPLGRVDGWPAWLKAVLPFVMAATFWFLLSWPLGWMQHLPVSMAERIEQSVAVGLGSYLVWKFPAGAILALYLLNSYIYFGKHPFWKYIGVTAQKILRPLKIFPLQLGKVDFAPVLGIVVIFLAAEGIGRGLAWLYTRLPF